MSSAPRPLCSFHAKQDIASPEIKYSSKLWWGRTWHMQTPLETLGPGSTMVFELRDVQASRRGIPVCQILISQVPDPPVRTLLPRRAVIEHFFLFRK